MTRYLYILAIVGFAAFGASVFGASTASAFSLLDNFEDDQAGLIDNTIGGVSPSNSQVIPVTDTDLTGAVTRTMTVEYSGSTATGDSCGFNCATSVVDADKWSAAFASETEGYATINWAFTSQSLTDMGGVSILVDIIETGETTGSSTIYLTLFDGTDTETKSATLVPGINYFIEFDFASFTTVDLTKITEITIKLDGSSATAFDVAIDLIGAKIEIPEPATLGLFGFGLIAFGLFYNRRRRRHDNRSLLAIRPMAAT